VYPSSRRRSSMASNISIIISSLKGWFHCFPVTSWVGDFVTDFLKNFPPYHRQVFKNLSIFILLQIICMIVPIPSARLCFFSCHRGGNYCTMPCFFPSAVQPFLPFWILLWCNQLFLLSIQQSHVPQSYPPVHKLLLFYKRRIKMNVHKIHHIVFLPDGNWMVRIGC